MTQVEDCLYPHLPVLPQATCPTLLGRPLPTDNPDIVVEAAADVDESKSRTLVCCFRLLRPALHYHIRSFVRVCVAAVHVLTCSCRRVKLLLDAGFTSLLWKCGSFISVFCTAFCSTVHLFTFSQRWGQKKQPPFWFLYFSYLLL